MEISPQIEKLKLLISDKGLKLSSIEIELGMPANNLSNILKGNKQIPKKYVEPLDRFIEKESKEVDEIEKKIQEIFDKSNTPENRENLFESIAMGIAVISETDENGVRVLAPDSDEWWKKYNQFCPVNNGSKPEIKFVAPLTTKEQEVKYNSEHPDSSVSIEEITISDYDRRLAEDRIKVLESELKSPPKTASIGVKTWIRIRERELSELKAKLKL